MNLSKGFDLTKKFYPLIFIPIFLDFLQLGDILRRAQMFSLKLTVPSAVPSLIQVLADPPQGSAVNANLPFGYIGGSFLIIFVLFVLLSAFLKGGFLGCVFEGVTKQEVSLGIFIQFAKKYFIRFSLQFLLTFMLVLALVPFVLVLGPIAFILLIGIMILFFFLIFWDYIIVVENAKLIEAAKNSINLVRSNIGKVFSFILPIVIITAIFGIVANELVANPVFAVIAIIAYAYFGTGVVFAIMSFYIESLRKTGFDFLV